MYKPNGADLLKAHQWYTAHSEHVQNLLKNSFGKKGVEPTGSDASHPELWKAIHWIWFFNFENEE